MIDVQLGIANLNKLGLGKIGELKKLKTNTKNRVRAILGSSNSDSIKVLNQLRLEKSARELVQVDNALRQYVPKNNKIIPDIFPDFPQTTEIFFRLESLSISKEIEMLEILVSENFSHLSDFFNEIENLNKNIIEKKFSIASKIIGKISKTFGYSHLLLRKAAVIQTISDVEPFPEVTELLDLAGLEKNNLITSSLVNCFKAEQDFFSLKKSIMSLRSRGTSNKYTRDLSRIAFHPFAKDDKDLSNLLQSAKQSCLIDAVIISKVNFPLYHQHFEKSVKLKKLFDQIDNQITDINSICSLYASDKGADEAEDELTFYKQSSAWLENKDVVNYRTLLDHFYDSPDSDYFDLNTNLLSRVKTWVNDIGINELAESSNMTRHSFSTLRFIENTGYMTRSAIFNYNIYLSKGYEEVSENSLFELMDKTRDLAKTAHAKYLGVMAKLAISKRSKLIFYFLIARKSKNELDNHTLRRILQSVVTTEFDGKLIPFFDDLASRSKAVAEFAYEVCSEDFIAKLFNIIHSTSEITETRAQLHKWMGTFSGEKAYFDRARTLLIDHQLNKIRDEIDDNRIYVDAARFSEWMNDEVMRELSSILMGLELKSALIEDDPDPQLMKLIEQSYTTFCSNNIFGIASYLGRRIRHGTFKGHLYSSVITIERIAKYREMLDDFSVAARWEKWKLSYEEKVNQIIKERLHIESSGKRDGLIKPNQSTSQKIDILSACAKNLTRDYFETKNSGRSAPIIIDYCWRLAENDLKAVNSFLKNQKSILINKELLQDLKSVVTNGKIEIANDFQRELVRSIDEKLMAMYNWFKRPFNVSPKASLSLLYKAVVAEVKETFVDFSTNTDYEEDQDIELVGGAYHVIYDSLYVIVYNAAKHGKKKMAAYPETFP